MTRIDLHVWGSNTISLTDPESRACAWMLCIHLKPQNIPFKIVPSSNTNLAQSHRLPVLITKLGAVVKKYEGYSEVAAYISQTYNFEPKFIPDEGLSGYELLVNLTLANYISSTLQYVNQYNLYVNTANYELYTRKLFGQYLPFPMMYNQPLKFYHEACEQAKLVGLGSTQKGFFDFAVADTELVVADSSDEAETQEAKAISALHEKAMLAKEKKNDSLRKRKYALRCLGLMDEYIGHVQLLFTELNPNSPVEFAHLFRPKRISSLELLLYLYLHSLVSPELPDRSIAEHLEQKHPAFYNFTKIITEALDLAVEPAKFRAPKGAERPTLLNEVAYRLGFYTY